MQLVIRLAEKLKPLLIAIFPIEFLRKVKSMLTKEISKELLDYKLLPYEKAKFKQGINLIGNIKADTGIGQGCRLLANLFEKAGIAFGIYYYDTVSSATNIDTTWDGKISDKLPYGINLVSINPNDIGMAYRQLDRDVWKYHYNIAFWAWELEEFPDEWVPCMNLFHEIWAPSEFVCEAIRKKTSKPVRALPFAVTAEANEDCGREYFHLPEDKFLFYMMYDSASVMERKNPKSVIKAFQMAFDKSNQDVGLVIKMKSNSETEEAYLRKELEGYTNVYFIKKVLTKPQVDSLIKCVDVLVSLHRSEGFGLPLAEAMLIGTPVIATNWSANTEFMNSDVACMVDYKLVTLTEDIGPFKKGQRWADADIQQAAAYMQELYEKREKDVLSKKAAESIKRTNGEERISRILQKYMNEIEAL